MTLDPENAVETANNNNEEEENGPSKDGGDDGGNNSDLAAVSPFAFHAIVVASLGGIMFGYDLGVAAGALPSLTASMDLTTRQQERVISFIFVGMVIGALSGGVIADKLGRRFAILVSDAVFVVGAATLMFAASPFVIIVGRIEVGIASTISLLATVTFVTEIVPKSSRGSLVSAEELFISFGFLLAYSFSYLVTVYVNYEEGWRIMFGFSGIIAVGQAWAMASMPESPVWLAENGRHEEALRVQSLISGTFDFQMDNGNQKMKQQQYQQQEQQQQQQQHIDAAQETGPTVTLLDGDMGIVDDFADSGSDHSLDPSSPRIQIGAAAVPEATSSQQSDKNDGSLSTIYHGSKSDHFDGTLERDFSPFAFRALLDDTINQFTTILRFFWRQIIIVLVLGVLEQFSGHANILAFAPEIFAQVFFGSRSADTNSLDQILAATLVLGVSKFIATGFVVWKVDQYGRRNFMIAGAFFISLGLLMLVFAFLDESSLTLFRTSDTDHNHLSGFIANNVTAETVSRGTLETNHATHSRTQQVLALLGCISVVMGFATSFAPLTALIIAEIFPSSIRGRAIGVSFNLAAASAAIVSHTFLTGQERLGPAGPFIAYSIVSIVALFFIIFAIPDTGNVDILGDQETVGALLDQMSLWRGLSSCSGAGGDIVVERERDEESDSLSSHGPHITRTTNSGMDDSKILVSMS